MLLVVALKNTAMAADSGFIGTWKLNVQESTFVSRHFKAGTLTIDEGSPRPTDRDHPPQGEIWWTQEFINDDGQYEAMEWAGNLDGKVMPYKSRLPGTMSILRRDDRTLAFSILPPGSPAIVGTCLLARDGHRLTVTTTVSEGRAADIWVFDRFIATT